MATRLADAPGDAGGADNENGAIDYEAEARKMGWKPAEEFAGDPNKHVDAKTFYERGQEMMPILRAQNRDLMKRLDKMERDAKQANEFWSKAASDAYNRALADIKRDMEDAVTNGDTKAANAALEKLSKLEKPGQQATPDDQDKRAEEFADWTAQNRWYGTNAALQAYADAQADIIVRSNGGKPLTRSDLDDIAERVREKFADSFPDAFGKPQQQRQVRSPVDGGGSAPARRGGRTAADLPDGGAQMRRFIKAGYVKDEAQYLKNYNWDDRK
jgi:hypothetical protein